MEPVKIIDIIKHRNKSGTQTFIVVDRYPVFLYKRDGIWLVAEDSGFFSFYFHRKQDRYAQAFAGRQFVIPLVDGEEIEATGDWWDGIPKDYQGLVHSAGMNTPERLSECNVFTSSKFDPEMVEDWLKENKPTNNYHKYNKKHKDYMVQTIISQWDE